MAETGVASGTQGDVTHQSTSAEDLAGPLADQVKRLALLRDYRDRLEALRVKAASAIDSLIKVNHALAQVQAELEAAAGCGAVASNQRGARRGAAALGHGGRAAHGHARWPRIHRSGSAACASAMRRATASRVPAGAASCGRRVATSAAGDWLNSTRTACWCCRQCSSHRALVAAQAPWHAGMAGTLDALAAPRP